MKKTTQALIALGFGAALSAALLWYYDAYVHWQPKLYPIAVLTVTAVFAAFALFVLWARGERRGALAWKTAVCTVIFTGVLLIGVSAIINNWIGRAGMARQAAAVAMPLAVAQIVLLYIMLLRGPDKRFSRRAVGLLAAGLGVILLITAALQVGVPWYMKELYKAPVPPALSEGRFTPRSPWGDMADFTVSPDGLSMEDVRDAIREERANGNLAQHFSVEIMPGEYNIRQVLFDERDYKTSYSTREGNEAVLNGGMRLEPEDFTPWEKNENIQVIDLGKLGLTAGDWGRMYSFGAYHTGAKYDGGAGPLPCELFFNGRRCVTARYPNGGEWLRTGKVLDNGDAIEYYDGGRLVRDFERWESLRNPRGGTFSMDKATAARAASWASIDDVWIFGCFKWDWADMSTPVQAINNEAGTLTTEHASCYGYDQNKTYYFYNVLEELDEPGEWYLDRGTGLLYLWPPEGDFDTARIDISLSTETLIAGEGLEEVVFSGLTLQGTRGDGISLRGDNLTVEHCVVRNVAGSGISLNGYNNTVSDCEVYRVGRSGISIGGGDAATLTPGNSRAVNNLVHDWPEVVMTYQGGVNVHGTGNLAAHNEIYNSPHSAMFIGGNNNVIEYNLIHDVCLITHDAGAIYGGRSWYNSWGTIVRNNVIYNLGSGEYSPDGIYLDDGLAGVTVENNLLVNVPGSAIAISGRDLQVHGNIVVNAGRPVSYDQRTRDGALSDDPDYIWHHHWGKGGVGWDDLLGSPWQTDIWKAAYPKLAAYSIDFADIEDASFAANPAGSLVAGNVFAGPNKPGYANSVLRFSTVENNTHYVYGRSGSYWSLAEFGDIQAEKAGRTIN